MPTQPTEQELKPAGVRRENVREKHRALQLAAGPGYQVEEKLIFTLPDGRGYPLNGSHGRNTGGGVG